MPRRETPFIADVCYHFYNRGNNRQAVFFESDNYLYFLKGVKKYLAPVATIIVYCLMPTHYHILVRVKHQTSEVFKTSEVFNMSLRDRCIRDPVFMGVWTSRLIRIAATPTPLKP